MDYAWRSINVLSFNFNLNIKCEIYLTYIVNTSKFKEKEKIQNLELLQLH